MGMTGQNTLELEVFNEKNFSKSDSLGSTSVAIGSLGRSAWTPFREKLQNTTDSEKEEPFVKQASPILGALVAAFIVALPHFVQAVTIIQDLVDRMPEKIFYATLGFLMCFFGGFFPATI